MPGEDYHRPDGSLEEERGEAVQGLLDLAVGADAALADPDVGAVVGHQRGAGVPEGALVVGEIHGRDRGSAWGS